MKYKEFIKSKIFFLIPILILSISASILLFMGERNSSKAYIRSEDQVVAIDESYGDNAFTLDLSANGKDAVIRKSITLVVKDESNTAKDISSEENDKKDLDEETLMQIEVSKMLKELNQRMSVERGLIELPESIGDNIKLTWTRPKRNYVFLIPLLFPPFILLFLYRGEKDAIKKKRDMEYEGILLALPSFNNKIVLLLGSGLVYEESIRRIGRGSEKNTLTGVLKGLIGEAEKTNNDVTFLLKNYAGKNHITELKRITSIIIDNRQRGTDLISKLSLEGELLWEKRKKRAEEKGRIAESKLTIPLGIMMVSLLLITAGPALMQM